MLFTLLIDWRLAITEEEPTRKNTSHEAALKCYTAMKESATSGFQTSTSTTTEQLSLTKYTVAKPSECDKRIQEIIVNIDMNKKKDLICTLFWDQNLHA